MLAAIRARLESVEHLVRRALSLAATSHIAVDDKQALQALHGFVDGTMVWVKQLLTWWHYRGTRPVPEDGITVIYVDGGGCWIRDSLFFHAIQWQKRTIWHIDFDNGDDWADGLAQVSAIKTFAELVRRTGDPFLMTQSTTLYCYGVHPISDHIRLNIFIDRDGPTDISLTLIGPALMTLRTGVLTAVTLPDRALNRPFDVTADFSSTDVGLRIRIPSGPRAGTRFWAVADLAAGKARISEPGISQTGVVNTTVPQLGDPFVVEQSIGPLYVAAIRITAATGAALGGVVRFITRDCDFAPHVSGAAPVSIVCDNVVFQPVNCWFRGGFGNTRFDAGNWLIRQDSVAGFWAYTYAQNCSFKDTSVTFAGKSIHFLDTGFGAELFCTGGFLELDQDFLLQANAASPVHHAAVTASDGGVVVIDAAGVMDFTDIHGQKGGFIARDHGAIFFSTNTYYGTGGYGWGVATQAGEIGVGIQDDGTVRYETAASLTITGPGGDFRLGGRTTGAAYAIATGLYTEGVACAWVTLPVAGKDNMQDVPHNARIYKSTGIYY